MRTVVLLLGLSCGTSLCGAAEEPRPQIFSWVTLVGEQSLVENPKAVLQGDVESMSWDEIRIDHAPSGTKEVPLHSRLTKYDADAHVIEDVDQRSSQIRTVTTYLYQKNLLATIRARTLASDGNQRGPEFIETHRYDADGRLLEVRRERGQNLENHYLSHYDPSGRLASREIRQGPTDGLVYTEKFVYTEDPATTERRVVLPDGQAKDSTRYRLDERGNVVELWSNEGYHVRWKFDTQDRVVEQLADSDPAARPCDVCPIPGRIETRYDDAVRVQTFFEPSGKAVLRRVTQMEKDGSIASIRLEPPPGARPEDAPDLNHVVSTIVPLGARRYIETTWDGHGNWTEKRVCVQPNSGSTPIVQFVYRRKIVYR